jgi:hypothetical protein
VVVGVDRRAVGVGMWRACIWESSDLDGARLGVKVEGGGLAGRGVFFSTNTFCSGAGRAGQLGWGDVCCQAGPYQEIFGHARQPSRR